MRIAPDSREEKKVRNSRQDPTKLFQTGDLVLLRNRSLDLEHGRKLEAKWKGPFRIHRMLNHHRSALLEDLTTGMTIGNVRPAGYRRCTGRSMAVVVPPRLQKLMTEARRLRATGDQPATLAKISDKDITWKYHKQSEAICTTR